MTIDLTPQQLQILDSETDRPHRVVDRRQNTAYVLVSEAEYEAMRAELDEAQDRQVIARIGLQNASSRAAE